jgi:acetyl-CoA carboxylase biotin carboxyl carrier protein
MAQSRKPAQRVKKPGVSTAAKSPAPAKRAAKAPDKPATGRAGRASRDPVGMVREIAAVIEQHGLSEVIVELPDVKLTLRRGELGPSPSATPGALVPQVMAQPISMAPIEPVAAAPAAAEPAEPADDGLHTVTSPFVGTFYRRPNPDSDPYAEAGQRVERGQILCIVEAMKLMNEIEADISGTIETILVADASPVEYGQALFAIRPV